MWILILDFGTFNAICKKQTSKQTKKNKDKNIQCIFFLIPIESLRTTTKKKLNKLFMLLLIYFMLLNYTMQLMMLDDALE